MSAVRKAITISAPVGRVFNVVTSPDNWMKYVTSLVDVNNMSENIPQKGSTFKWEYKMMGIRFKGKGTVTENVKNKSFGMKMEGKFPIIESYDFIDKGDSTTELVVKVDYEVPGGLFGDIANKLLIEKMNVIESKNVLDKIKMMCESK